MQLIIVSSVLLFALVAGMLRYRSMNVMFKLYFFQLVVWIFFYVLSHVVELYQKKNNLPLNNQWVFNLSTMFEISILLIAARNYFFRSSIAKWITTGIIFFLVTALVFFLIKGASAFNVATYAIGSLIVSCMYFLVLQQSFHLERSNGFKVPILLVSSGVFLYFTCNLPYFSLFNYLNTNHLKLSQFLFHIITDVFANLRYLLLGIGFLLLPKPKFSST